MIVDDEEHCRMALSALLARRFPEVELMGTAADVREGVDLIRRVAPGLVFLDVEMGDRTGFDLLSELGDDRPHIVFTTAHENYAVRAIRFSAIDYLLKPVDADELRASVDKALAARVKPQDQVGVASLLKNLIKPATDRRLALPVSDGLEMVPMEAILYCAADSNYTLVHLKDRKRLLISRTLKEFEDLLEGELFVRVHHGYLINVRHVRKYIRGEGGEVIMADGTNVAVSRRKKQEFLDALERL